MNSLTDEELVARIMANLVVILVGIVLGIILLRLPQAVTLINEPCAPSHPVFMNGIRIGCVNDKPTAHPDFVRDAGSQSE